MPQSYLLDTSAILAYTGNEPGADRVEELFLSNDDVLISWPTIAEVYYRAVRERGAQVAIKRLGLIRQLPVQIIDEINERIYLKAANFKARFRVSFADSLIAAYAQVHDAILVHKDPEFVPLASDIKLEALPYKPAARNQHRQ